MEALKPLRSGISFSTSTIFKLRTTVATNQISVLYWFMWMKVVAYIP